MSDELAPPVVNLCKSMQEPAFLVTKNHEVLAFSDGFVTTFFQNDTVTLDELWPQFSDFPLDSSEQVEHFIVDEEEKDVEVQCVSLGAEYFLLRCVIVDEADEFFHQQRLQTLGMLAGSVAHDFNNVLAGILGHVTFLKAILPEDGAHQESLEAITSGAKKASTLTKQILDFSKYETETGNRITDIVELVSSTVPLLRGALSSRIELALEIPDEPLYVQGTAGRLAQILVNLVVNSRDAIEQGGGGTVIVRIRPANRDDIPPIPDLEPEEVDARYVLLEVEDDGAGMSERTQRKALEPYFSTKGERGTGLGLPTVASITESYGGMLEIESQEGEGTSIRIFLREPADDKESIVDSDSSSNRPEIARGDAQRVLVVDDEDSVRNVVAMSLRHLGYEVEELGDPRDALAYLSDMSNEYDLALLDMLMPHLTGDELFEELRKVRPNLPVIIMSGYSKEESVEKVLKEPSTHFMFKPFTVEDLSHVVSNVLQNEATCTK